MITQLRLRLKEVADPLRWNPHSIAHASGLAYSTVYAIWTGKARRIDLDTIKTLCNTLDILPSDLISIERG